MPFSLVNTETISLITSVVACVTAVLVYIGELRRAKADREAQRRETQRQMGMHKLQDIIYKQQLKEFGSSNEDYSNAQQNYLALYWIYLLFLVVTIVVVTYLIV